VACWLYDPSVVSIATGKKMRVFSSQLILCGHVVCCLFGMAAAPCSAAVELRWDSAH